MSRPTLSVVSPDAAPSKATWHTWEHGRYRETPDGGMTYYIRARIGGARVEVAVAADIDSARAEWALFSTNPAGYKTPKQRAAEVLLAKDGGAVRLDEGTLNAFIDWYTAKVAADEMSRSHAFETLGPYTEQWAAKLKGRDLHKVTLDELQGILKTWDTAQRKRIVAIKTFARWARTEKKAPKLRRSADPTLDLTLPRVVAAKKRGKKGYEIAYVEEFYTHLHNQTARDMIRLRAFGNGMHDTEIQRIAAGKGELRKVEDPSGIYGTVTFHHKKKRKEHVISLDKAAFQAAERLQTRGAALSRSAYHDALHKARIAWHGCKGQPRFFAYRKSAARIEACPSCPKLLPNELRHSFATWGKTKKAEAVFPKNEGGVAIELLAEAMGHGKNTDTTAGFYVGDYVPVMIRIPIRLEHPEDPK